MTVPDNEDAVVVVMRMWRYWRDDIDAKHDQQGGISYPLHHFEKRNSSEMTYSMDRLATRPLAVIFLVSPELPDAWLD